MSREKSRKICFDDAFDSILNGNVSELEDLSSDEDIDDNEDVVSYDDGDDTSDDNGSDDNDDTGDESVPQPNPDEKIKLRWRSKDLPISDERFSPEVDDIEETKSPLEYFRQFWTDEVIDLVGQQLNKPI